ncbi:MAG: cytochrome c biogenesis protein ResB [Thermodesulfobacteriota bacterium]|nr:cytochrome c biogenesis protein ResB [Thermodesulfobacteriota bacterium]
MASSKNIFDQIIDFFASVRLALVLLIALAVTAIGGTIIPQNLPYEQYVSGLGPKLYTFLSYLDMFDMYHAWWFNALLALLLVNLLACSIDRLPKTIKLSRPVDGGRISPGFLKRQSFSREIVLKKDNEAVPAELKKIFSRHFTRPKEILTGWGALLWAEKRGFSRFGVYIVHLSIFFIVAGAMLGSKYGFEAWLNLNEGETVSRVVGRKPPIIITLPFSIRLDRFVIEYYETGAVSEFRSKVTVFEQGHKKIQAEIKVNHPLIYRGVTFYQSSYGRNLSGVIGLRAVRRSDNKSFDLKVRPGRPHPLPQGGGTVTVLEFVQDLVHSGPAIKLLVRPGRGQEHIEWAFEKRPGFVHEAKGPFAFTLTGYKTRFYTGLQVNRDPGVWLVWIGCGLMLAGFIVTFLFAHQKLFIGLVSQGDETRIIASGSSHRNRGSFKIKFERLAADIAGLAVSGEKKS